MELPKAWTPIREALGGPLSGERLDYWNALRSLNRTGSTLRYVAAPCGRRSLKSLLPMRSVVLDLPTPKEWSDPRYAFTAPTRDQAKNIAWDYLKALTPPEWIQSISESDLCIKTVFGSELWVVGLDRPQRIEGRFWDGIIMSERADVKEGALAAHILPALSSRKGWLVEEGTPDYNGPSHNEYRKRVQALRERPDAKVFHWTSDTVLPPEEVEKLREQMPEGLVRQELGGSFEEAPGRAYPSFNFNTHVRSTAYIEGGHLLVSCDFNYTHHNWGLYQYGPLDPLEATNVAETGFRAFGEIYGFEHNVEMMLEELKRRVEKLQPKAITFYGDYAGEQKRAEATGSAWRQIKNAFPQAEYRYAVQPRISDRLEKANIALKNANGKVSVQVDPKCKNLIADFEEVARKDVFGDAKGGSRTHASDNFGYLVCQYRESLTAAQMSALEALV